MATANTSRVAAFARLRAEVRARGLDQPAPWHVIAELAFHVAVAVSGAVIYFKSELVVLRLLGMVVTTLGATGVGTNTHTSSHQATSDKRWLNELLLYFGFPLFLQLSATSWKHTHITMHHANPNVDGVDGDADLTPWLTLTEPPIARAPRHMRFYYKHQWLLVPFMIFMDGYLRQFEHWHRVIGALSDRQRRSKAHVYDALALCGHWVVWVILPSLFLPVSQVLVFHFGRLFMIGYPLFCILAPGHMPVEAVATTPDAGGADFLRLQTAATVDFYTNWYGRLLTSGLGYQLEHHLFPRVSHVRLRTLSFMVRDFCEREGLPYRSFGWPTAIWKSWMAFKHPKPVFDSLEEAAIHAVGRGVPAPRQAAVSNMTPRIQ